MRKLLLVGVLGIVGSSGCAAVSDWRLESRIRRECEQGISGGDIRDPIQRARLGHEPAEKLIEECYEGNINQIRD